MKRCSKCGFEKIEKEFGKSKNEKDGLARHCKKCRKDQYELTKEKKLKYQKKYYEENREKVLEYSKQWRTENPDKKRESDRRWETNNRDKVNAQQRKLRQSNPGYQNFKVKKSKLKEKTPPWANQDKIKEIYIKAHEKTLETGIPYTVDHIIPLTGKDIYMTHVVSGLHVETNLQIIPLIENMCKNCFIDLQKINS